MLTRPAAEDKAAPRCMLLASRNIGLRVAEAHGPRPRHGPGTAALPPHHVPVICKEGILGLLLTVICIDR